MEKKEKKDKMTGQHFGRWTVMGDKKRIGTTCLVLCRCDCGVERYVRKGDLAKGKSRSCGCLRKEDLTKRNITHGMTGTRTYHIWYAMKQRCYSKSQSEYSIYGGRGIEVCDRWRYSFENFLEDMGVCPEGKTIDRIDSNGNYEPSNCRWATQKEQMRNFRGNIRYFYEGKDRSLAEITEMAGMNYRTVYYRMKSYGWSFERAISEPAHKKNRRECYGAKQ